MKLYEFINYLYCYTVVVIAYSEEEAKEIIKKCKNLETGDFDHINCHEIKVGFILEAGGNG